MMKLSLFLFLMVSNFCISAQTVELLNPEVFFYVCSEKWSGRMDSAHFFGLLDQLNSIFEINEKLVSGENFCKKKYKKSVLETLTCRLFLQETVQGKEILELFLQVLSDCPITQKHEQSCQFCQKNAKFVFENRLAAGNMIKFICLKKTVEKSNFFKWIGFFGTLAVAVAGLLITENIFSKKYQSEAENLEQKKENKKLKSENQRLLNDLKEQKDENEELTQENSLCRDAINKELNPQIRSLVRDFAGFKAETLFQIDDLTKQVKSLKPPSQ